MLAYTNTESRRQTHRHTDRQSSADNTALGFGPPEFSCLPVAGSPYRMASIVHQTWGYFFLAEPAASQRVRWPRPYAGWNV